MTAGRRALAIACAGLVLGATVRAATPDPANDPPEEIHTVDLGGGVYQIRGRANASFVVGRDGVLLVDTMTPGHGEIIRRSIAAVTPLPVRAVVNTHFHGDHVGSNAGFGAAGIPIVAQRSVLARMSITTSDVRGVAHPPAEQAARPSRTFDTRDVVDLPGIHAVLVHLPGAHTDGDCYVWLPRQNVIMTGDVVKTAEHPFPDVGSGGSLDGTIAATRAILARIDGKTRVLPGHGGVGDRAALRAMLAMMLRTRDQVAALVRQGRTRNEVLALGLLRDDHTLQAGGPDFRDLFVGVAYDAGIARLRARQRPR